MNDTITNVLFKGRIYKNGSVKVRTALSTESPVVCDNRVSRKN